MPQARLQVGALLAAVTVLSGRRGPDLLACLGRDVEHRLLDVEHRQHLGDHVGGDGAATSDLQHPLAFGLDHGDPDPGVELARSLLVGDGAEPLPGGEVALVHPWSRSALM